MEFRILGPIELWTGDHRHNVGWAKERAVLASLLMTPGQPVSTETLVDRIWDADPPGRARDRLYSPVARLRTRLHDLDASVRLLHRDGAYILDTDPERIDLHRFRRLKAQARSMAAGGDEEQAIRLYREAALLWRGEPLAGLDGAWAERTRRALEEELLTATLDRIDVELRLGRHAELVSEIAELAADHPFDERLVERLMLALYRSGRQADALDAYQQARRRLMDQLATEVGPSLRGLHRSILRGDASLAPPPPKAVGPPNSLPRDVSTFTGRQQEIAELLGQLDPKGAAACVLTIDGMAGVGKTTLAVHLAHRLWLEFPDGTLFLDLCGTSGAREPLDTATALDRLLRQLGIPSESIPSGLDDRAALWRAELSRRRILYVLDDATEHDQLRHLLPNLPGSLAIVTSRHRLAGLDDVQPLSLEVLPQSDAVELFGRIVGRHRSLDTEEAARLVGLCGRLPLAIQLVGNRLRHRPAWRVADLSARLANPDRTPGRRLSEIRAGNRTLAALFAVSYQGLAEEERRAFRLLGIYPGAEISTDCAEVLMDVDVDIGERLLESLLDHHLLSEPRPGRYRFHDLVAEYARMLVEQGSNEEYEHALDRLLDHCLGMLDRADSLLYPYRQRLSFAVPTASPLLQTPEQAREWLAQEVDNLLRVIDYAAEHERAVASVLLSHLLGRYLHVAGHWAEATRVHERAVRIWRGLEDRAGLAHALTDLATVFFRTGRHADALRHAMEALAIRRDLDDRAGVGVLLDTIGQSHWHLSEYDVAAGYLEEALAVRRALEDVRGEAESLAHLAIVYWHRGDHQGAADRFRQALALFERAGDERSILMTHNNLGDVEFHQGHYEAALDHYQKAAAVTGMGRQYHAIWLNNIANVAQRTGRTDEALENYRAALAAYREIGDRRGESDSLTNLGHCYLGTDRDGEALIHFQRALSLAQDIHERFVEVAALRGIGLVHTRAGRTALAEDHLRRSLDLARTIGSALQEAQAHESLGDLLAQSGDRLEAQDHWQHAHDLYKNLGTPDAGRVSARLERHATETHPKQA
jgi:DNA-binding SARP family transcriptional activator/Tfp pilus assembly protein PilF